MNNLYYIEYTFQYYTCDKPIYGEVYAVDTGFGVLELGCVENGTIYEDVNLLQEKTIKEYINNFGGEILSFTKVA